MNKIKSVIEEIFKDIQKEPLVTLDSLLQILFKNTFKYKLM